MLGDFASVLFAGVLKVKCLSFEIGVIWILMEVHFVMVRYNENPYVKFQNYEESFELI